MPAAIADAVLWTTTSNKQLNFVQHVRSLLKIGGRAAVVLRSALEEIEDILGDLQQRAARPD